MNGVDNFGIDVADLQKSFSNQIHDRKSSVLYLIGMESTPPVLIANSSIDDGV